MELDKENKNDIWTQAGEQEIWELQCLNSFRSIGFKGAPLGHKTIPIFFVCDDVRISCEPGGRPSQACPSHCPRISPQVQASALETIANLAFPQKWAFPDSSHWVNWNENVQFSNAVILPHHLWSQPTRLQMSNADRITTHLVKQLLHPLSPLASHKRGGKQTTSSHESYMLLGDSNTPGDEECPSASCAGPDLVLQEILLPMCRITSMHWGICQLLAKPVNLSQTKLLLRS